MYRVTAQEVQDTQNLYKENYRPFRPFVSSPAHRTGFADRVMAVMQTQNGMDTDDYSICDDNKVEKHLKPFQKGSRVLLLGVGTGRETLVAKDMGFDVTGITFGSRNLDFGHNYLGLSEIEHFETLAEVLPFQKETFDVVAGFQVFEHTIAPIVFLLEQGRVLKYDGTLILEWPPTSGYHMGANPHHQICFTPGQAKVLFEKAGLVDVTVSYDTGTPVPESNMWTGDQTTMLVIKGKKRHSSQKYINDVWEI